MIEEDLDGYYITVYYPDYLESNIPFINELSYRARSIHQVWFDISEGKIVAEASNTKTAKLIEEDFARVVKRFLRKKNA